MWKSEVLVVETNDIYTHRIVMHLMDKYVITCFISYIVEFMAVEHTTDGDRLPSNPDDPSCVSNAT